MTDIWKEYQEDVVACGKHHCIGVDYCVDEESQMVNIVFHYSDSPFSSTSFKQITTEDMQSEVIDDQLLMKMVLIKEAKRVGGQIDNILAKHRN